MAAHLCPECGARAEVPGRCADDGQTLAPIGDDTVLGTTIARYRVTSVLGTGGAGRVYRGVQPDIGGRVAIKVLSPRASGERDAVDRFFAEARAVNLIRHESIVKMLDLDWLPDGRPFIVMELLDGAPLSAVIAQRTPLPLGSLCVWMREVLGAIAAAHARGIVHRDLKPHNLWVTPTGRARVLDFGLAKLAPELDTRDSSTRSGLLLGTPHYMAPEQADARRVDGRADLYALGVVLYEAATGVRPFDAPSLFELLRLHLEEEPASPRQRRADIPPGLDRAIRRALEKKPEKRFADAEAFSHALAEVERGLGQAAFVPLAPPGAGDRPVDAQASTMVSPTPVRRSRSSWSSPSGLRTAAVVASAIALGGVAVALSRLGDRATPSAPFAAAPADAGAAQVATTGLADATAAAPASPDAAPVRVAAAPTDAGLRAAATPSRARADAGPTRVVKRVDAGHMQMVEPEPPPPGLTREQADWRNGVDRSLPGPAEAQSFDLVAFMPKARAFARDVFPDADLVMMYATKVPASGVMDLTSGGEAGYLFRTRTMEGQDARCYVRVLVYAKRIEAHALLPQNPGDLCEWPIAPTPDCSTAELWQFALDKQGADATGRAYVRYLFRKGARVWEFAQLGGGADFKATDECP